ncbi:hypothetical protein RJT34_12127 [Clitoria ternatea]|uniref:Uncharacterized protein n=1 Tax=Clitoria ternatea TaxID=43366 RepID=A0AAN9PK69_CLITE
MVCMRSVGRRDSSIYIPHPGSTSNILQVFNLFKPILTFDIHKVSNVTQELVLSIAGYDGPRFNFFLFSTFWTPWFYE